MYFTDVNGYRQVADGVTAVYDNSYSAALDGNDAIEINNWDENIAIAREGKHLAIESRPQIISRDSLPLFMNNMRQMAYEFQFTGSNFPDPFLRATLIDNFTGTRTPLSVSGTTVVPFSIIAAAGAAATDRFMVVFGPPADPLPTGIPGLTIYPNPLTNRTFTVQFTGMEKGTYPLQLFNSAGQLVFTRELIHNGADATQTISLGYDLAKGNYQLAIILPGNKRKVFKLVIGE